MTTELLPQPPPDVVPPPAGPAALRSRRWLKIILVLGFGSIGLFLLAALVAPLVLRSKKKSNQTQATNNARQIGMALFDFESEYGRFPDETAVAEVKRQAGTTWDLKSETSNDLFRQLIVAGITQTEEMFYAKVYGAKKPTNLAGTEADALARGECGFAYLPPGKLAGLDSSRPLAVTPLIPGTTLFDPVPFEGKAVMLKADNSVQSYPIRDDGRAIVNGRDLFDPSQLYWSGAPLVIKWPDLPAGQMEPKKRAFLPVVAIIGIAVAWPLGLLIRKRWKGDATPVGEI